MHKTLIIAAVALSGVVLTSLGLPESTPTHKTVTIATVEASKPFSDTLNWKLLGQIKYIKKAEQRLP
jgi:hypothetical protein